MNQTAQGSWPGKVWRLLISPGLSVVCLVLLFVLTFWGTIYQVQNGLYAAKERYFDAYVCTIGIIPFPGAQLVMAVFTLNLLCYIADLLIRGRSSIAIFLTHGGLVMLMLGGALTHHYGDEGHLTLAEGEVSNVAESYQEWELALWRTDMGVRDVRARNIGSPKPGDLIEFPEPGLKLRVRAYYANARAFTDAGPEPVENSRGIQRIESAKSENEPERNRPGAVLELIAGDAPARRVLFFGQDAAENIHVAGTNYTLSLRHRRYPLPVRITLKDFRRMSHPGTEIAKSYESLISAYSADGERDVLISMNRPFRDKGFTFYQASFSEAMGGEQTSTFAVTRNAGRLVPYISTGVIFLGMLAHFGVMLVQRARKAGTS